MIFPDLLNDYGIALAMAGHQDDAILAFQRAIRIAPDNDIIQSNLRLVEGGANVGFNTIETMDELQSVPPTSLHSSALYLAPHLGDSTNATAGIF